MKIILTSKGHQIKVDDEDYDWLNTFTWHVKNNGYVVRNYGGRLNPKQTYIHRLILGISENPNLLGDHVDHDPLNNTRSNLRIVTYSQNNANKTAWGKSKYLGVSWFDRDQKWAVYITINRKTKFVGRFFSETEAALAYNIKATEVHGEFANLNII